MGVPPHGTLVSDEARNLGRLAPIFETIARVKSKLPQSCAMLGFCGAPWTVASYMIAGRGTPDLAPARLFAYRYSSAFQQLIERLVEASVEYLSAQFAAGVEAVQIFESFAGEMPVARLEPSSILCRFAQALRVDIDDERREQD
ncbi:MAG: hypothetical protein JO172_08555 [Hyphomicrobiales bacterium]|nr:hypothetical protein [Hyphomicrobiales bacterium]